MLHYKPCKSNQTFSSSAWGCSFLRNTQSTEADVNSVSFILNRGESLLRCSQCKTARYCSVQCQVRALHTRCHQRALQTSLWWGLISVERLHCFSTWGFAPSAFDTCLKWYTRTWDEYSCHISNISAYHILYQWHSLLH